MADEARELLKEYEKWEAKMLLTDEVWKSEDGLPHLTQELFDEWLTLQLKRYRILYD